MTTKEKLKKVFGEPDLVIPSESGDTYTWHKEKETIIVMVYKEEQ